MNHLTGKYAKFLLIIAVLTGCFYSLKAQIPTQTTEEIEVPILQKIDFIYFGCYIENNFYDEASFKRLTTNKDCSYPNPAAFKPDFKTQTLIGYRVYGDCPAGASAAVFRNDKAKKYEIRIRNVRGGCRSGGGIFQGWFTIEKIRPDYKVDFSEIKVDNHPFNENGKDGYTNSLLTQKSTLLPEALETRSFQMNDCIQLYRQNRFIIKDDETFKNSIRNDGGREKCVNNLEKIDFGKHTLIGLEINSGYCRTPVGLEYQAAKDSAKKEYILGISYIEPEVGCRALSQYDLWVLVPKIPENYRVNFEIKSIKQIR